MSRAMDPQLPLLYTYRRCPYAMRARMALLVARLPFTAYEIVLREKPAALLAVSPKATVPVLVMVDGRILEESRDIMRWALTAPQADGQAQGWWERALDEELLALQETNDGPFKRHLDRYKYPERFAAAEERPRDAVAQVHRAHALQMLLEPLDQRLARAPYLGGTAPCATDLGIFPFVRQFAAVDAAWFDALPLPHLQRWLDHWVASPLFDASMARLAVNQAAVFPAALRG